MKGDFIIACKEKVIVSKIVGQWDIFTGKRYVKEFQRAVLSFPHSTIGHIVHYENWELAPKELDVIARDLAIWAVDNGVRRVAEVFRRDGIIEHILNSTFSDINETLVTQHFNTVDDAYEWLEKEGYPAAKRLDCH